MNTQPTLNRRLMRGFTLLEMAVVLVVIGVLIAVVAPKLKGSNTQSKATALYEFSSSAVNNWRLVGTQCGTSTDVTASVLPSAGAGAGNALNLVITANGAAAAYSGCFGQTNISSLRGKVGGAAGAWTVQGFTVSWGATGANGASNGPIAVQFSNLDPGIALALYNKYSSATGASSASSFPTAADTTDPMIQFTATTAGSNVTTFTILIN